MSNNEQLIYHIARYIQSLKGSSSNGLSDEEITEISTILESRFPVDDSVTNFETLSYYPVGLKEIFDAGVEKLQLQSTRESYVKAQTDPKFASFVDMVTQKGFYNDCEENSLEYLQRRAKLVQKFNQIATKPEPMKQELELKAEEKKTIGNAAMTSKDYEKALKLYTEAIELSPDGPNSHVYYSNRAAAYCYTNQHELSVLDCESAIALKSDYVKAYSRLGFSNFFLGRLEEAVAAYEKAVSLEPTNKENLEALRKAKKKLEKSTSSATESIPTSSSSSNMPDLSALVGLMSGGTDAPPGLDGMLKNPKMKEAFDKMGGMNGLSNLMKDPNMMAVAQNLMKNPAMVQQAMSMFGNEGIPDLSALGENTSSSGNADNKTKGGKIPFKGFED
jgi:small glutamine-rich tetratricopeptide repeat-containing protein alpha